MIGEKFVNRAKILKSFDVPLRRMIYLFFAKYFVQKLSEIWHFSIEMTRKNNCSDKFMKLVIINKL